MAGEWDVTLGMDFMRMGAVPSVEDAAASPAACLYSLPSASADTLGSIHNVPGRNNLFPAAATNTPFFANSNQTFAADKPFSGETNSSSDLQCNRSSFDFDIPCEEEAELEWLSQFVEDSFSDVPYQYAGVTTPSGGNLQLCADQCVTGRAARSKRSRCSNPSAVWSTLTPPPRQLSPSSSSSSSDLPPSLASPTGGAKSSSSRGKKGGDGGELGVEGGVRRCTHCASEKTPQWRTGPLGPKTLCNACGVRFKSGRLLPEYRPAASPTFVLTQHSNSHRKVMELRRQKEVVVFLGHESHAAGAGAEQLLLDDKGDC